VLSTFAHISQVSISLCSMWPNNWNGILLTISEHLQSSYILLTCPPIYSPQRHLIPNHFEWHVDEHTCPLQMQPCWHMHFNAFKPCN
jgi:hypothetical protein